MAKDDEMVEESCGCVWHMDWEGSIIRQVHCLQHVWGMNQSHIKISVDAPNDWGNAYVSKEPYPGTDVHYGVHKHSDTPVAARWNDVENRWESTLERR